MVFAQKRASKAVYKQFKLFRPTVEMLHTLSYVIASTGRESVGITIVLNSMGVNSRDRQKNKRHFPLLVEKQMVVVKRAKSGESVSITPFGYTVLEFYNKQFYPILQAGEMKYGKRLKYAYYEELPLPR